MFFCINAQGQEMKLTKHVSKDGLITYETNFYSTKSNDNAYEYKTSVSAEKDIVLPVIQLAIATIGDSDFLKIIRQCTSNKSGIYTTKGNVVLVDGEKLTVAITIQDISNEDYKDNEFIGAGEFTIGTVLLTQILHFRKSDIKCLLFDNYTVDFQKMGIKTAKAIDGACKHFESDRFYFGHGSSAPSNSNRGTSTSRSAEGDKSALDLIYYPMGFLEKDGKGLDNYKTMLNALKNKTNWEFKEFDTFFRATNYSGLGIFYDGLKITNIKCAFGDYRYLFSWHYQIDLAGVTTNQSVAEKYTRNFIKELTAGGFNVKYNSNTNAIIDAVLLKGTYKVGVTLFKTKDDYWIDVESYPRYNE